MSEFLNEQLWVILLLLSVAGAGLLYAHLAEKKRREALIRAAGRLGMSHQDSDPALLDEDFASFHLFSIGYSRDFSNIMRGEPDGLPLVLFDYRYTVSGGKNSTTYRQSVACYRVHGRSFPKFEMCPENVMHKFASLFGYQDIDFNDHPGFSQKYLLRSSQEGAVRAEFSRERLSALELRPGWNVEGSGEWLIVYKPSRRVTPENFPDFLRETREVARAFAA